MSEKLASDVLEQWIEQGHLKPKYQQWIHRLQSGDTWYTKMLKDEGKEAADLALEKWVGARHLREFSASVESIGRALLALSKVNALARECMVLPQSEQLNYPSRLHYEGDLVIIDNPNPGGCGCSEQPEHVWEFYPGSVLGITHFGLQADAWGAQLCLIFANSSRSQAQSNRAEYKMIKIETDGTLNGEYCSAELNHDTLLYYNLGLVSVNRLVNQSNGSGGSLDEHFRIPKLNDYLVDALPRLAVYLTELAAKLAKAEGGHAH